VAPKTLPFLAVTTGDPAGIGPEIVAHLFSEYTPENSVAVLIGAAAVVRPWAQTFGLELPTGGSLDALGEALGGSPARVVLLETGVEDEVPVGAEGRAGGRHAGRAIEVACELARNHSVGAIVTAPISKKSLNLAEFQYSGHTEMLAHYLNSPDCQMMMVHDNLRVVPLTRHLPLRDVPGSLTQERIITCMVVVDRALREQFGLASPRIAVAGLNPHAGDGGVIGREEIDVIAPALESLRKEGIDADGPLPADAMFQAACERGGYDAYVAMYHDQGLVPFKVASQRRGVNVTVGLPVIRTSVDHGTAFDIAGKGIAETQSLLAAYKLAESLAA
jgi:4-hydroxythreonine-4-phosphate dehydrogenase